MATIDPARARYYRFVLLLAAAYNLAFGAWAVLAPHSFFTLCRLEPPRYPSIWACLGMVVGVYGLGYGYAARHLERAGPLVALGLIGKIAGPIGWVVAVRADELPVRTLPLVFFNDLVWWLPFTLFLLEGTRAGERLRAAAPWACAALNAAAALGTAVWLAPGTELDPDPAARAAYIGAHPVAWRLGWALWTLAAIALLGFFAWWGARSRAPRAALIAFAIAAVGLLCDLLAESLLIAWVPGSLSVQSRLPTLLTGAAANGLYTLAGILLTATSGVLRGGPGFWIWTWAQWGAGLALTAAALLGSPLAIAVTTALLMTLTIPWVALVGRRLS